MATKTQIIRHECYPDSGMLVIFDVYAGDDPRDYAAKNFKPMAKVQSFRTRAQAEAFAANLERA